MILSLCDKGHESMNRHLSQVSNTCRTLHFVKFRRGLVFPQYRFDLVNQ